METLCSIVHEASDGSARVFDFVVGSDSVGWFCHEFDPAGRYGSVGRCAAQDIGDRIARDSPAVCVVEMRAAAGTLQAAATRLLDIAEKTARDGHLEVVDLLVARAGQIQDERLAALDLVMEVCEDAWDEAVGHVERVRGADPTTLDGALRTVELLWSARAAVRQAIRYG